MRSASVSLASRDLSAPLDPASSAFSLAFASALPRLVVAASACAWSRTRSFSLRNALFFSRHSRLWLSSAPFTRRKRLARRPKSRMRDSMVLADCESRAVSCSNEAARVSVPLTYVLCASSHVRSHARTAASSLFLAFSNASAFRDLISSRAVSNRARRRTKKLSCAFSIASRTSSISLLCLACFSLISSSSFLKASATSRASDAK